ncbi:MAG: transcription-repair coupling factor, partial [Oscillospiraceae bacterium]|nr:transcription-repair coupling factor [Oscillospiraceae bacterium]
SGFLMSVGYDMYLKLLEEAVLTQQGKPLPQEAACAADLSVAASIPDRYVPSPEQRMDLYRRIAHIRSEADADDMTDELIDRYGDPPRSVNNLIAVALLRAGAAECGMTEISQKNGCLLFTVPACNFKRVAELCGDSAYKGRLLFSAGEKPYLSLRLKKGDDPLRLARKLVDDYASGQAADVSEV